MMLVYPSIRHTKEEQHNLVVLAKSGNLEARNKLIYGAISIFSAKYLNEIEICYHDDLKQELFFNVVTALNRFTPNENIRFYTYLQKYFLRTITESYCYQKYGVNYYRTKYFKLQPPVEIETAYNIGYEPEHKFEVSEIIENKLSHLSELERMILNLKYGFIEMVKVQNKNTSSIISDKDVSHYLFENGHTPTLLSYATVNKYIKQIETKIKYQ